MTINNNKIYASPNYKLYKKSNNVCIGTEYELSITFFDIHGCRLEHPRWETIDDIYEKFDFDSYKNEKIEFLKTLDNSDELNTIYINDVPFVLRKDMRSSLRNAIESLKEIGKRTITIWSGTNSIELLLKQATKVLNEIECYAQEVFQITSLNNKKIVESRSKEELDNLNLEEYPSNLHITV